MTAPTLPDDEPRKTLTDRTQIYPEHSDIIQSGPLKGQQRDYVVLAQEEIDKGFVRPYRNSYKHLKCGTVTSMGRTLSETYARDPYFYGGTFCCGCQAHFPIGVNGEFVWISDGKKVGT